MYKNYLLYNQKGTPKLIKFTKNNIGKKREIILNFLPAISIFLNKKNKR